MNKIPLISIPAYEFYAEESLVQEVLDEVVALEFVDNTKNFVSKSPFYNYNLYNWIESCLEKVREIYYSDNLQLKIVSCWANKTTTLQQHAMHNHINSIVSGVLYLNDSNSELEFIYNDPWLKLHNESILGIGKSTSKMMAPSIIVSKVTPVRGKLLLFPSSLTHKANVNTSKNTKYSISFNRFVSGKLNPDSITADLSISLPSVTR